MKTIEEKAKAYDEAFEKAKEILEMTSDKSAIYTIFPGLEESEDERIRKTLIEYFNAYPKDYYGELKKSHILTWLEKQGEKPAEWKQENIEELSEFENAMMHIGGSFFGKNAGLDPNDTDAIKEQAKLLQEFIQNPAAWKPSDEQMEALERTQNGTIVYKVLESLYNDLKKLK